MILNPILLLLFASYVVATDPAQRVKVKSELDTARPSYRVEPLEEPANGWHRYVSVGNGVKVPLSDSQAMVKLALVHHDHVPVSMLDHYFLSIGEDMNTEKGLKLLKSTARAAWTRKYNAALKAKKTKEATTCHPSSSSVEAAEDFHLNE